MLLVLYRILLIVSLSLLVACGTLDTRVQVDGLYYDENYEAAVVRRFVNYNHKNDWARAEIVKANYRSLGAGKSHEIPSTMPIHFQLRCETHINGSDSYVTIKPSITKSLDAGQCYTLTGPTWTSGTYGQSVQKSARFFCMQVNIVPTSCSVDGVPDYPTSGQRKANRGFHVYYTHQEGFGE